MTRAEMRLARKQLGMTQVELAEKLGMQRNSVVRMENGSQPIMRTTELAIKYLLLTMGKNKKGE